jgi:hypothetical protein
MLGILGIHLLALVIFGSWTVYQAVMPKDPTFEEPPPMEKIERVQLEYKVRMQEKQKQSQRPKQKLQVKQISQMNMPDVDIQVPNINSNSAIGRLGNGNFGNLGDGGGLSLGEVSVNLFDIKAKGEKFLFIVDVRRDLLQDAKGGIPTYNVIKEDVIRLINDLPSGVLFNMILFDRFNLEIWQPQLVAATKANKEAFAAWLTPVNSSIDSIGVRNRNYRPTAFEQPFAKRVMNHSSLNNSTFMATVAGLEQKPDAIFILADSMPDLERIVEREQRSEDELEDLRDDYIDRIKEQTDFKSVEEYREARNATDNEIRNRMNAFRESENKSRAKKGIPPRVYTGGESRDLRNRVEKEVAKNFKDYVPRVGGYSSRDYGTIPEREVEDWLEQQQRLFFDQNADERPQLNAIVFKGKDELVSEAEEDIIDDYVDIFNGDYRVLIGLGQIDSSKAAN